MSTRVSLRLQPEDISVQTGVDPTPKDTRSRRVEGTQRTQTTQDLTDRQNQHHRGAYKPDRPVERTEPYARSTNRSLKDQSVCTVVVIRSVYLLILTD